MDRCFSDSELNDFIEYKMAYADELKLHVHLLHCETCRNKLRDKYLALKKVKVMCGG
jgi:hypothetical protein